MLEEAYEGDWIVFPMACQLCTFDWTAVCPVDVHELECPRCHGVTHIEIEISEEPASW